MSKGKSVGETPANRNYKDTVFRMLFKDRERLLGLYNAVSGRNYKDLEELEIVTLENAVYMGMKTSCSTTARQPARSGRSLGCRTHSSQKRRNRSWSCV